MSFTVSRSLNISTQYTDLGIIESAGTVTKDVTYTATDIISDDGETAYVRFSVAVSDVPNTTTTIYAYDTGGTASTLDLAETALQSSLS